MYRNVSGEVFELKILDVDYSDMMNMHNYASMKMNSFW